MRILVLRTTSYCALGVIAACFCFAIGEERAARAAACNFCGCKEVLNTATNQKLMNGTYLSLGSKDPDTGNRITNAWSSIYGNGGCMNVISAQGTRRAFQYNSLQFACAPPQGWSLVETSVNLNSEMPAPGSQRYICSS